MSEIIDLDILRPPERKVKIGGKQIDVSFVPCGITFEVDQIVQTLGKLNQVDIEANTQETKTAFDLTVKLCSLFCSVQHEELDEDWFRHNVSPIQVRKLAEAISSALAQSYKGLEEYQGNPQGASQTFD